MIDYYKCQYHFNASHSFDGNKEQAHSHTFTMILYIRNHSGRDMDFKRLDRMIEIFLGRYEGMYLNELPCFAGNASIEAIGDYFYEQLKIKLSELNAGLHRLGCIRCVIAFCYRRLMRNGAEKIWRQSCSIRNRCLTRKNR